MNETSENADLIHEFIDTILLAFEERKIDQAEARDYLAELIFLVAGKPKSAEIFMELTIGEIADR